MNQVFSRDQLLDPKKILQEVGVKPRMVVADFGCGTHGYFALPAARLVGDGGLVYAIDVRKGVIENINYLINLENITNIKPVWADLEVEGSTKIRNDFVDLVLLINVLFQSKKQGAILKEAHRVLKKGGRILLIDWRKNTPLGPSPDLWVDKREVMALAGRLGLEIEEEFDAGPYHFGVIFRK